VTSESEIQTTKELTSVAVPTNSPIPPKGTSVPTDTPLPTVTPDPTATTAPTDTATPRPTNTPKPTATQDANPAVVEYIDNLNEQFLQVLMPALRQLGTHLEASEMICQLLRQTTLRMAFMSR
jgi:hypothetical protein